MEPVTREQLYEMVWEKPMLKLAETFGVSGSYLARVCTELRVPRPERGHWAKLEFGKSSSQPPLPPTRPGDITQWKPGMAVGLTIRTAVRERRARSVEASASISEVRASKTAKAPSPLEKRHDLLVDVRPFFLKTRDSDTGLLRPFKKHLVDVISSERHLDSALEATDKLFRALTTKGHRVLMAQPNSPTNQMRRAPVDERETPGRNEYRQGVWSPDRITVVYVGDIPIGLTLFEMTESVEMVYVGRSGSRYLPVRDLSPAQLRRYPEPHYWRTHKDFASGRLALQAYSPSWRIAWAKRWQEKKAGDFAAMVPGIVSELEAAGPELARQLEEARLKAEAEQRKWQEEQRIAKEAADKARQVKNRQDARNDLIAAIAAWEQTRSMHAFFEAVARDAANSAPEEQEALQARLELARSLVGELDALGALKKWKAPSER